MTTTSPTHAFDLLDHDQRVTRLTNLATEAVDAYGLPTDQITLLSYTNNAVFLVVDSHSKYVKNAQYVLRVHRPGLKRLAWLNAELAWLSAIRRNTALSVPEPIGAVHCGELNGVDLPVYCTLLGWVPGQAFQVEAMTPEHIRAIGRFAAELHTFSASYTPPDDFERPSLDWEGLFGTRSPYHSQAEAGLVFTNAHEQVINATTARVRETMSALDAEAQQSGQQTFGLIHADLIAKNILFDGEDHQHIGVIDFDDCAFGYYLYDLSPMLWVSRTLPNYQEVKAALWEGYTSVRELPAVDRDYLEAFVAARHVASCRWVAGNANHPAIKGKAAGIISQRITELDHYLQHGALDA